MAKKILVVDDSQWMVEVLTDALENEGYRVFSAQTGIDGYALFKKKKPNLVISDYLIPGMDGLELCKKIKKLKSGADVPVIMVSGIYKQSEFKRQILKESGAQEYLDKPIQLSILLDLVEKLFSKSPSQMVQEMISGEEE